MIKSIVVSILLLTINSANLEVTPDTYIVDENSKVLDSGPCGDDVIWTMYEDGTLVISGEGEMEDYSYGSSPYKKYTNKIKAVVFLEGVEYISNNSFNNFYNLASVVMSDSVFAIGEEAFCSCEMLTEIDISDELELIENRAFAGTPWLDNLISQTNDGMVIVNDILLYADYDYTTINIPEGVIGIAGGAGFILSNNYTPHLTSIYIPSTVRTLGSFCFYGCSDLANVDIVNESNLEYVGDSVFGKTIWQNKIVKDSGVVIINDTLVSTDIDRECITVPETVKTIAAYSFSGNNNLKTIILPNSVYCIRKDAFFKCEILGKVVLPDNLGYIGNGAFSGCSSLYSINLEDTKIEKINNSAFQGCENLRTISIPKSVKNIGLFAFQRTGISEITISPKCTYITGETYHGQILDSFPDNCIINYYKDTYTVDEIIDVLGSGQLGEDLNCTMCEDGTLSCDIKKLVIICILASALCVGVGFTIYKNRKI